MIRTTVRTSRKTRRCDAHGQLIAIGDRYLETTTSPNHDGLGTLGWITTAECSACATRYGRGHLLATTSDMRSEGDQ